MMYAMPRTSNPFLRAVAGLLMIIAGVCWCSALAFDTIASQQAATVSLESVQGDRWLKTIVPGAGHALALLSVVARPRRSSLVLLALAVVLHAVFLVGGLTGQRFLQDEGLLISSLFASVALTVVGLAGIGQGFRLFSRRS